MRLALSGALLSAACNCALALEVQSVGVCMRDGDATGLSGITWTGGNEYIAVCDNNSKMYPLSVKFQDDGVDCTVGTPVALEESRDLEGCAFDPLAKTLWASDEKDSTICEFECKTGALQRRAPVPETMRRCRKNYSLEALTMAPDGLSMWTANEEALPCDGELSSASAGTTVRLLKFTRKGASDDWRIAGQWAYRTEPLAESSNPMKANRCGLSSLCALSNGTLLALERELSGYTFRFRIYEVALSGATDVSGMESLSGADFTPVNKRLVYSYAKRYSMVRSNGELGNYEGMCIGPQLPGGGRALVLVADAGDKVTMPLVMVLRLLDAQAQAAVACPAPSDALNPTAHATSTSCP